MKALHIVPTWWPATRYGGTIVSVRALCAALVDAGVEVDVATTDVDGGGSSGVPLALPWDDQGVSVHSFPSRWGRRTYFSPPMKRFLRAHTADFDIVHTHSVFLWPTWQAARCAQAARRPYIVSPRGMLVPELIAARSSLVKRIWMAGFERSNLRHAAAIHVTSSIERDDLLRMDIDGLPRIEIIPNGVEMPILLSLPRKSRQLLFVGRLSWKKGLDRLIDALALLPDASLIVAGPDNEGITPELLARAARIGVSDRMRLVGEVDAIERTRLLAESTLLVLPSLSENFGNSVAEAMAAGCPVVVTQGVGVSEHVRSANAGIVVGQDPESMAVGLRWMISHPDEAATMGGNGRRYVVEHLSWAAVAQRMQSLYASLTRRRAEA